jgi:hypothetical protein
MKLIVVLSCLLSLAFANIVWPFTFDHTKLRNIWESPALQPAFQNRLPSSRTIAEVNRDGRIINGSMATAGQFPYHVLLVIDSTWWCGGSIIKSNWILTVKYKQRLTFHKNGFYFLKTFRLVIACTNLLKCLLIQWLT